MFAGWALGQPDRTDAFAALGALCVCCIVVMLCKLEYLKGLSKAVDDGTLHAPLLAPGPMADDGPAGSGPA